MPSEQAGERRGVFEVDERRAAEALRLAWGDYYHGIGVQDGRWKASRSDGGGRILTGETPDELNAAIRADWACRSTP
jgi:hypothetical protein